MTSVRFQGHLVRCFLAAVLLFSALSARAARSHVPLTPPPAWVKPVTIDYNGSFKSSDVTMGYFFMLMDQQANQLTGEYFNHEIRKIISEEGVQNGSNLTVEFDPSYQRLRFHYVRIIRNGQVTDRTKETEFNVIEPERRLDDYIVDGSLTAVAFLQDIRKGDIIEYAYSVQGMNPVYEGKVCRFLPMETTDPLFRISFRLIVASDRPVQYRTSNFTLPPVITERNGTIEYEWVREHVAPVDIPDQVPGWYDIFGDLQVTQFGTWADLHAWAVRLFAVKNPVTEHIRTVASQIQSKFAEPEDKLIAALRFIQDEIRYTGIETGEYSHRPVPPGKVLDLRYGDCKGKSLLLCTLLGELGIEAYPALVNSYYGKRIAEYLPSPDVFNHCIVKVLVDGKSYWFDPTISYQRGKLGAIYCPPYGKALVINDSSTGLTDITASLPGATHAEELFIVPGTEGSTQLQVITEFTGSDADDFRSQVASSGLSGLEDSFLKYYGLNYPDIETEQPMEIKDDSLENRIVAIERYTIKEIWQLEDSALGKVSLSVYPENLKNRLTQVKSLKRTMPLALNSPMNLTHVIKLKLWEPWNINNDEKRIDNKWFAFDYHARATGDTVILWYSYRALSDHVLPAGLASYNKDVNKLLGLTGYSLTWNPSAGKAGGKINLLLCIISVFFILLFVLAARKLYRRSLNTGIQTSPRPLGGWLMLILIGLAITPFRMIFVIASTDMLDQATWNLVTETQSPSYHAFLAPLLTMELLGNLFVGCMSVFCIILMLKARDLFPRTLIFYLAFGVVFVVLDALISNLIPLIASIPDPDTTKEIFRSIVAAAIWIPYMLFSSRVKETFVVPYATANRFAPTATVVEPEQHSA